MLGRLSGCSRACSFQRQTRLEERLAASYECKASALIQRTCRAREGSTAVAADGENERMREWGARRERSWTDRFEPNDVVDAVSGAVGKSGSRGSLFCL